MSFILVRVLITHSILLMLYEQTTSNIVFSPFFSMWFDENWRWPVLLSNMDGRPEPWNVFMVHPKSTTKHRYSSYINENCWHSLQLYYRCIIFDFDVKYRFVFILRVITKFNLSIMMIRIRNLSWMLIIVWIVVVIMMIVVK